MEKGQILCSLSDEHCIIKMVGNIQHEVSFDLGYFARDIKSKRPVSYIIDLTDTTYLDSTSLGILASLCTCNYPKDETANSVIYSTNPKVNDILKTVGFFNIFNVLEDKKEYDDELTSIHDADTEEIDLKEIVLTAHKKLSSLSDENMQVFSDVINLLDGDECISSTSS